MTSFALIQKTPCSTTFRWFHSSLIWVWGELWGGPHACPTISPRRPSSQPSHVLRTSTLQDYQLPLVSFSLQKLKEIRTYTSPVLWVSACFRCFSGPTHLIQMRWLSSTACPWILCNLVYDPYEPDVLKQGNILFWSSTWFECLSLFKFLGSLRTTSLIKVRFDLALHLTVFLDTCIKLLFLFQHIPPRAEGSFCLVEGQMCWARKRGSGRQPHQLLPVSSLHVPRHHVAFPV